MPRARTSPSRWPSTPASPSTSSAAGCTRGADRHRARRRGDAAHHPARPLPAERVQPAPRRRPHAALRRRGRRRPRDGRGSGAHREPHAATKLGSAGPYVITGPDRIDTLVTDAADAVPALPRRSGSRWCGHDRARRAAVRSPRLLPQRPVVRRLGGAHPGDPRSSGLSAGELGLALAFLPVGAIIAMPLAGALAARAGSRRATRAAFALACTTIGVVAFAPSLAAFAALASPWASAWARWTCR